MTKSVRLQIQISTESEIEEIQEIERTHEIDYHHQSKLTKRQKVQVLYKLKKRIESLENKQQSNLSTNLLQNQ